MLINNKIQIEDKASEKGLTILVSKPFSNHPADSHLTKVACKRSESNHNYACYLFNSKSGQFYSAQYFETKEQILTHHLFC